MPDPRTEFDAALIPGMRERLADVYVRYRATENKVAKTIAPPEAGGNFAYSERDCPGCGATPPATTLVKTETMELVLCSHCGLTYSRHVMDADADAARYRASDLDDAWIDLHCSPPYLELESSRARYYLDRLGDGLDRKGTLLEIGCGTGTFLVEAAAKGWKAVGIEPGAAGAATARARGVQIIEGYFPQDLPDNRVRFDAIAALDVLEHITDPRSFLRAIRRSLTPDGRLFIQVPNWDSLLVQLEGASSSIVCPWHWTYFTPHTLEEMVTGLGFRTCSIGTVVSEVDRMAAFSKADQEAVARRLRPAEIESSIAFTPAKLHDLLLGYKLIGVFQAT